MIIKGLLRVQQALNEERKTNRIKGALQPFCNAPFIQGLQMPQGS